MPPSMTMGAPVMNPLAGLRRNAIVSATSSGVPRRPSAAVGPLPYMSGPASTPKVSATARSMGVSIKPLEEVVVSSNQHVSTD